MRTAERAFTALLVLALASSVILVALLAALLTGVPDLVSGLLLLLAFVGIALGMTSLARQLWATHRLIRGLLARRAAASEPLSALAVELGLAGRVDVVRDDRPFSFTYWFLRPRICLSTGLLARLAPDELRAVLCHERFHLRRRDPLRLVVARYFAAGLYVVPLVADLVEHYVVLKEVAADEDVVRTVGVRPLARALYKLMAHADEMDLGLLMPVGGLSVTEARIEQLVEQRPIALRVELLHVALSVATLFGASLIVLGRLPLVAAPPDVQLAWPPAALILLAAISGATDQLRAVTCRSVEAL